jgi:hypothetical protein
MIMTPAALEGKVTVTERQPTVAFSTDDPLAKFREKGEPFKQQLLSYQGRPAVNSTEVAHLLSVTSEEVRRQRAQHKLVAVVAANGRYLFPLWQFCDGVGIPGLPEVLAALEFPDEWTTLLFLRSGDPRLEGDTPLERLQAGDIEAVVAAAKAYGHQISA